MVEKDMEQLGEWIVDCLTHHEGEAKIFSFKEEVASFCQRLSILGLND